MCVPAASVISQETSTINVEKGSTKGVIRAIISATPTSKVTGWNVLGWEERDLRVAAEWFLKENRWRALLGRNDPNGVSHRIMEWFVVNYSKDKNIKYMLKGKEFNVSESYRNHMFSLVKVRFDMFKRTGMGQGKTGIVTLKVTDDTGESIEIETNLRQMNFYRWAIVHKVLDYVKTHKQEIMEDMSKTLTTKKRPQVVLPDGTIKIKRRRLKESTHEVRHIKKRQRIKVC